MSGEPILHEIQKGDTYWELAKKSNGKYTSKDIETWNPGVNPNNLKVGSFINLSDPGSSCSSSSTTTQSKSLSAT